ncbi:4-hydroxy 2-oxovalerate aldolase [Seinonella peptonophila]|uniref:4-hydroxy 2-oxovalerate aldolase n=1 Tax=Seinonella peptonophila TaxID=112248 RepID=A0A1M4SY61_9BACL|nr:aldolase catalytic domain-containing protein [Seinonella peptonophila]SHE37129.1 4-hydroxy 2-oxovalerate aldolase [Seinonella peptonophila]
MEHKVIDVTIRDGGLVNDFDFSVEMVRSIYDGLNQAGIDYMEIGYKNSPKLLKGESSGPWRFLDDRFLRQVIEAKGATKLSCLVDIGRVDESDILPREESLLDLVRVACYIKDVPKAIELVNKFHQLGYETSINIMALSNVRDYELKEGLQLINESPVDLVYVVDSFGNLLNRDIEYYVEFFQKYVPQKTIGIHTHNNLQLAFSNTLVAMHKGTTFLDSSLFGMGRAAGNCPTELLFRVLNDAKYDLRPILKLLQEWMIPLREKVEWGYTVPYALTGMLNEHPRTAMALRNSEEKDEYLSYYDRLTSVETYNK